MIYWLGAFVLIFATDPSAELKALPDYKVKLEKSDLRASRFDPGDFEKATRALEGKIGEERSFTGSRTGMPYRLYEPDEKVRKGKKLPLVIFLHAPLDVNEPLKHPQFLAFIDAKAQKDDPCYLLAPRLKSGKFWGGFEVVYPPGAPQQKLFEERKATASQEALMELIAALMKDHAEIDPDRVYLTGLSAGGSGCFWVAEMFPRHFSGLAPVCAGTLKCYQSVVTPQKLAVWAFVNRGDEEETKKTCGLLLDRCKGWGGKVQYNTYTDQGVGGHSAWNWAYAEPHLANWLFKQKREKPKPGEKVFW